VANFIKKKKRNTATTNTRKQTASRSLCTNCELTRQLSLQLWANTRRKKKGKSEMNLDRTTTGGEAIDPEKIEDLKALVLSQLKSSGKAPLCSQICSPLNAVSKTPSARFIRSLLGWSMMTRKLKKKRHHAQGIFCLISVPYHATPTDSLNAARKGPD
jgi:hypothetical protein